MRYLTTFPWFQFTHPGGVRRRGGVTSSPFFYVSIHAPGRGATRMLQERRCSGLRVSIHAPGRGATTLWCRRASWPRCFNSRTREGCDPVGAARRPRVRGVSIHAPGRGATLALEAVVGVDDVSIHAPGRGATRGLVGGRRVACCFNSRTREGCDVVRPTKPCYLLGFNSRTREGCDSHANSTLLSDAVSIHAPGRGATAPRSATSSP